MFLQRLELQGFKSFVDKTVVEFGDGITGVVGPNGCGKTNVSDAIRWVLGEQSARQLRGESMEDVIFNGCPTRKPIGMAEVHLTFRNDRGILPTEFSEVTISRRVFRSGMSEYSINKAPCRLRDIRDLFFDTGMGSHAYSVIERSMVDHVLSDNSGHRRFLFEEASGITKYKARKKETLSKLEATEGDLTRLNDIVFEIEREMRSLARQVGKARRFQRLRDGIRDIDLMLTSGRILQLRGSVKEAGERWQEEAVRREGVTARVDALEAELNDQKLALLELERELMTAQSGLKDKETTRVQAEHQIVLLEERSAGLKRRVEEAAAEVGRMRERLAETVASEATASERREAIRTQTGELREQLATQERELESYEAELRQNRSVASEHKQLSLDLFSTEAEKRGACQRVLERAAFLTERRAALVPRIETLEQRSDERAEAARVAEERRVQITARLDEVRAELVQIQAKLEGLDAAIHESDGALAAARQSMAAAESRLAVLLELKRNLEGVSDGVKSLFHDPQRVAGLIGVLADVLDIPGDRLDAVEAALGEAAAFVLVDGRPALLQARDRMRTLGAGRATLIDVTAQGTRPLPALPSDPNVQARASELVRCEPAYRPLVDRLLGNVVIVDGAAAAERLAEHHDGLRFVSADGEVWDRGRVRVGATGAGGLLHREREIRELNGQIAELALGVEALDRDRESRVQGRLAAVRERGDTEARADQVRTELEAVGRDHDAATRERDWSRTEAEQIRTELATLDAETESLSRARTDAERELEAFQAELERARARLADLDVAVGTAETRRDAAAQSAHAVRERLLELSREELECETAFARAEQTRRELEHGIEVRLSDARQSETEGARIQSEVTGLAAGLAGLKDTEGEQRERVVQLQQRYQTSKEEVAEGEDASRRMRFEQTELSELLHTIELDRVQHQAELDRTFERLRTEYELDPEGWTPAAPPDGFDSEAAGRDLESSRQRLRTLGVVNLLALEEYGKKKERWQFLTRQREDLLQARTQLLEAIDRINVTASQLFVETFEKVQVHFRDIFKTLFEGGDAELRTIGEDPLECEIEIAAKPRGKFLQSISLMSGGERALTAIALLFAIYLVKPSPFCLLDEVDAPLDDANVERFLRMIRRFSDRTQFVVITHNKKTMEAAGCLYGVTMQELGVSKLVSVRFDRAGAGPGSNGAVDTEHEAEAEAEAETEAVAEEVEASV